MGESVVKLQERHSFQPISTVSNQAIFTQIAESESLRPPPASYRPGMEIESLASPASTRIDDPINARPGSHDPEKGPLGWHSHPTHIVTYNNSRVTYADLEDNGDEEGPKQHAIWILIYLSALSPLLTLPVALYTLFIGTIFLLLSPLCLSLEPSPICARFRRLLSPLFRFQLRLIYSSYDINDPVGSENSGIMMLVFISMLSPLYSMALALATWVAGVFWFYTAILGNPDGKEDRDDGREAVLAVREWWERWLIQSLESENHCTLEDNGSESGC